MKNRTLPYGYTCENGKVNINPQESKTLKWIFDHYLNGTSLLTISEQLNEQHIEYADGIIGWNKARLKRIIEDKRYLGDLYPALIDLETYEKLQSLKEKKNTQKDMDRSADIFKLNLPVVCPNCGTEMRRLYDKRYYCPQRWICKSQKCKTTIVISDSDFLQAITEKLNTVIMQPDIIQKETAEYEPNIEVLRLNNEITLALNSTEPNKEILRAKMTDCLSQKYKCIDSKPYVSERLKADFEHANMLPDFSADLCARTVKYIKLNKDCSVCLTLINDQQIGKEAGKCQHP